MRSGGLPSLSLLSTVLHGPPNEARTLFNNCIMTPLYNPRGRFHLKREPLVIDGLEVRDNNHRANTNLQNIRTSPVREGLAKLS